MTIPSTKTMLKVRLLWTVSVFLLEVRPSPTYGKHLKFTSNVIATNIPGTCFTFTSSRKHRLRQGTYTGQRTSTGQETEFASLNSLTSTLVFINMLCNFLVAVTCIGIWTRHERWNTH